MGGFCAAYVVLEGTQRILEGGLTVKGQQMINLVDVYRKFFIVSTERPKKRRDG